MKILILCSHRYYAPYTDYVAPFIYEQMQSLRPLGCEFQVCFVRGNGIKAYLRAFRSLRRQIADFQPDIIHAHYGLCCFLANMQRRVPVVSTFHGSDINVPAIRMLSRVAMALSAHSIFVSKDLMRLAKAKPKCATLIPCSVDTERFRPLGKEKTKADCRRMLGLEEDTTYILFSKEFGDHVKNAPLAHAAVEQLQRPKKVLLEFFGYSREQVPLLYHAVDAALLTSFTEGSPQFVKEAVACGCPIVSTDVGDVREVIEGVENAFLTTYDPTDVADKLRQALAIGHLAETHLPVRYTASAVAKKVYTVYQNIHQK